MKKHKEVFIILLLGFLLRLGLTPFGTLVLDHNTFVAWSNTVFQNGFARFYDGWSDYLPGYVYILWVLGALHAVLPSLATSLLYKLPAIFFDLATGAVIYLTVEKIKGGKAAKLSVALYIFNPAVLANSSLWGQVDAAPSFFALASVYFATVNPIISAICLGLGAIIKPQAALAGFAVVYLMLKNKWNLRKIMTYVLVGGVTFLSVFVPFYTSGDFWSFVSSRIQATLNQYQYTSVNAFNIWGLGGFWKPDTWQNIAGIVITTSVALLALLRSKKVKYGEYLVAATTFFVSFLFMTRLHERHTLIIFAPLLITACIYPGIIFSYVLLSFVYITNLYYSYVWITQDFKTVFSPLQINFLILINIAAFINFAIIAWSNRDIFWKNISISFSKFQVKQNQIQTKDKVSPKNGRVLLVGILIFALLTRLINLSFPQNEYFDEVYHAFTAKVLLHQDPKGWEWWNPNPEGFAYEWTHPPLAKEAMIGGMLLFGDGSFGWRIPAVISGVGCVLLLFLITKKLFKSVDIALLAAALFSLEGLPLVMSRIGMNDIYFLFFILLSFYLYHKDKYFFSSLFLGLAAASKWSTMWFLPFLVVAHFTLKKKFTWRYVWYIILPPLLYVFTYIPFFLSGHTVSNFIELQKQMWWYHTQLHATHAYSSPWWSWPLDLRPVWLYVNRDVPDMVSNIYAFGNPILIWTGFICSFMAGFWALIERNKKLALILFGYLVFFVSWALSPRIMFFYHFLPSIPFMVILVAYTLRRLGRASIPILLAIFIAFVYFYPHWTGGFVSQALDNSYYWLESWR
jgi:dolichyl-phosphate-mannose-protein mannosyltransferase